MAIMERNQSQSVSWILYIMEKGGSLVKLKENVFVFDEDGLCLFKIGKPILYEVLKDGRTERLEGELCTEYKFLKKYVIEPPDGG